VPTLMIHKALLRRLDTLARRAGVSTTVLGNLLLEAAVNEEERRFAREQRVARELEAILVRAILRGDYKPAATGPHERSDQSGPLSEAQGPLAATAAPGSAGSAGQPPLDRGRR
jgi:hypothetical protein